MDEKYTVAIIGCGRLGQHYAEVYQTLPNTELVAIAEYNPERRQAVGERFGIRALYQDAQDLFRHIVPRHRGRCAARQVHQGGCHRRCPSWRQGRLHRQAH